MHKSNPSQRDAYIADENLRRIGLDAAVMFHTENSERNCGEYNKSRHISHSAHPVKDWVGSLLCRLQPLLLAALPTKDVLKMFVPILAQIGGDEETEKSSWWKGSGVPEPLVMLYDVPLRDLWSAFGGLTPIFEDLLQKTKELRGTLATELAEQMIQKHGVPESVAYTRVVQAYDAFFKESNPKPLALLVEKFGDEKLRSKWEELWKIFGSFILLDLQIRSLIERIENLFKRHVLRRLLSLMRERSLLEKAPTDEKPLPTIASNPHDFSVGRLSEKPPPKANKVSSRFVSPSILTPSAPPCA